MIDDPTLATVSVLSWAVALWGSIGQKSLREFSRHQLDVYCRRRGNKQLFKEIVRRHDDVALGANLMSAD